MEWLLQLLAAELGSAFLVAHGKETALARQHDVLMLSCFAALCNSACG
jgi:hypothetical protein